MLWSDFEGFGKFFNPWQELERMSRALSRPASSSADEFPSVNIWVSGDSAALTTEIPGIDPGTIDISIEEKTLTLRGSRQSEDMKEGESYHRRERWCGQFTRTLDLPFRIEPDKVKAKLTKGVLYIDLPRAEAEKSRKIEIKSE